MKQQVQERQRRIQAELGNLSHRLIQLREETEQVERMLRQLEGSKAETEQSIRDWETFESLETIKAEDVTIAETGQSLSRAINREGTNDE